MGGVQIQTGGKVDAQIQAAPIDPATITNYALISGGVVQNIIIADPTFLPLIQAQYDSIVDLKTLPQGADVGSSYDDKTQKFTPKPIDFVNRLQVQLNMIHNDLIAALISSKGLTPADVNTAINNAIGDSKGSFSKNEQVLFNSIGAWISSGG